MDIEQIMSELKELYAAEIDIQNQINSEKKEMEKESRDFREKKARYDKNMRKVESTLNNETNPFQRVMDNSIIEPDGLNDLLEEEKKELEEEEEKILKKEKEVKERRKTLEFQKKQTQKAKNDYIAQKKNEVKFEKDRLSKVSDEIVLGANLSKKYNVESLEQANDRLEYLRRTIDMTQKNIEATMKSINESDYIKSNDYQLTGLIGSRDRMEAEEKDFKIMVSFFENKDKLNTYKQDWDKLDEIEKLLNSKDIMTEIAKADRKREEEAKKLAEVEAMAKAEAKAQRDAETKAKLSEGMKKAREAIKAKESQQAEPQPEELDEGTSLSDELEPEESLPEEPPTEELAEEEIAEDKKIDVVEIEGKKYTIASSEDMKKVDQVLTEFFNNDEKDYESLIRINEMVYIIGNDYEVSLSSYKDQKTKEWKDEYLIGRYYANKINEFAKAWKELKSKWMPEVETSKKQEFTPSDYFSMPWDQETDKDWKELKSKWMPEVETSKKQEFTPSDYFSMPWEQETEQKDNQQKASEEEQTAYEAPEFNPANFFSAPGDLEEKSKSQSEETQTTEEPTISPSEEKRRKEESILLLRDVKITIGRKAKISYKDDDGTHKDEEIDLNYRSLGAIGTDLELVLQQISYAIEKNNEIPDNIKDEIINKLDEKTELIENKKNYEGRQELNFDFDDLSKHSLIDIFRGPSRKIKNKLVETETLLESKGMAAHIGKYEKPKGIFAKIVDVFSRGKNKMIPQSEFKKLLTAGNQSYGRASEDIRGKVRDDEAARRVEEVGRNYSNLEENIIGETERRTKEEESQQK